MQGDMANELRTWQYGVIILGMLAIAYWPALETNFLRHDDWGLFAWDRASLRSHPYFYSHMLVNGRPIFGIVVWFSHSVIENFSDVIIIRSIMLIALTGSAVLLLHWFNSFNYPTFFSVVNTIAIFTLPPFQIVISTIDQLGAILALIQTQVALFLAIWACARLRSVRWIAGVGLIVSFLFFLGSLLTYSSASMFCWFLLAIALLSDRFDNDRQRFQHIAVIAGMCVVAMATYFLLYRFIYMAFGVVPSVPGREFGLETDVWGKIGFFIQQILPTASGFWNISAEPWSHWDAPNMRVTFLFVILILLLPALVIWTKRSRLASGRHGDTRRTILFAAVLAAFLPLSVAPSLLAPMSWAPYRTLIALMPLLLFLSLWSVDQLSVWAMRHRSPKLGISIRTNLSIMFFFIPVIGVVASNSTIAKYLVGPNQYELGYLRKNLSQRVVPEIKRGDKVWAHIIQPSDDSYFQRAPTVRFDEFAVSITWYRDWVLSCVVALLKEQGVATGSWIRKWRDVGKERRLDAPWGVLTVTRPGETPEDLQGRIVIDMNDLPKLP